MKIKKIGVSGTMESSDVMITLEPNHNNGIEIELNSTVEKQFGREIRRVIIQTLDELSVADARVTAVDKGALDCVLTARMKTAIYRACDVDAYQWEGTSK